MNSGILIDETIRKNKTRGEGMNRRKAGENKKTN
jgi:hypothetical protein